MENFYCHKGISVSIEGDSEQPFNWTTEKVETCDNEIYCQESVLVIKTGGQTAVLATKGCIAEGEQAVTFVQHSPFPGIFTISYSNYCGSSFCNSREGISELLQTQVTSAPGKATSLHCPTCVALGSCSSAPSLPCPSGVTHCYQGRLQVIGGGINAELEIKGCSSSAGCRLMSGFFTIGPMWVKEKCPFQPLSQPQIIENGATCLPIAVQRSALLLPPLLQQLAHRP
ncbi:PREDICTED: testis-expressed sequence 101 protein [Condylura cristata]|uniref:testis-expressed sequence 101 protein n=1 Tax=Condylura cristata TaxID=143302 RepID=UPI0003343AC6|nr:PREDICTED: testis-expressed sequence 101 protein [Condylura cristata]